MRVYEMHRVHLSFGLARCNYPQPPAVAIDVYIPCHGFLCDGTDHYHILLITHLLFSTCSWWNSQVTHVNAAVL